MGIVSYKSCINSIITYFLFPAKTPVTVHLEGSTHLGYDLTQIGGSGQPILAEKEHLHLEFRTVQDEGLLLYTGKFIENYISCRLQIEDNNFTLTISTI